MTVQYRALGTPDLGLHMACRNFGTLVFYDTIPLRRLEEATVVYGIPYRLERLNPRRLLRERSIKGDVAHRC